MYGDFALLTFEEKNKYYEKFTQNLINLDALSGPRIVNQL